MQHEPALHRCRRDTQCADRERLTDDNGDHAGWAGMVLDRPGLCPACTRHVRYAIGALPGDIDELSQLLEPSTAIRYRDPDVPAQPHIRPYAPVPLDLGVLSLQELIDAEATMWATALARALDLPAERWSSLAARDMRQYVRVNRATVLLLNHLDHFLALPVTETPARSQTARRADGHDPDSTTRFGDDYWANRDGIQAALTLLELHRQAEAKASRQNADRLPLPCPVCRRPALHRLHNGGVVDCRACGKRMTDQDYDAHLFDLGTQYGLHLPPAPPARDRTEPMPEQLPDGVETVRPLDVRVHALPVTAANLEEVRKWCGGTIGRSVADDGTVSRWVNVPGAIDQAHPGDVVVRDQPGRFRVLTAEEYQLGFEAAA